ncbi:HSF-type DNA-binding-domain-containing protein [Phascolomyces articulosus]|uniref:HSF-type DNA-binding-domain-containing protein n=1 Tax=Phascolomyces articulosus TaxID=60185 RepID=A0AAD5KBR6_9FUNG|nr:HSF-type DNA-binding-domain-containing protein [Phascolomyces articulosus]
MLEDASIKHLISWSQNGDLFSVTNPTSFSRTVLPQYFKHNNWQSFVRQLNMYGFHKVNDMIHSNLTTESQNWEFKHPHFRRGAVEDLKNIKRKSAKSRHHLQHRPPLSAYPNEGDEYLYGPMYKHILDMEERLQSMTKAYEVLHVQTSSLKSLLSGQQKVKK